MEPYLFTISSDRIFWYRWSLWTLAH